MRYLLLLSLCLLLGWPAWAETTIVFTGNTSGEHSPCPT